MCKDFLGCLVGFCTSLFGIYMISGFVRVLQCFYKPRSSWVLAEMHCGVRSQRSHIEHGLFAYCVQ